MALKAFDTETHLIQPGLQAPPLVLGSIATEAQGPEACLSKADTRAVFLALLCSKDTLVGARLDYDLGVMVADDPELISLIFDKLDADQAVDVQILEKLHLIAQGALDDYTDNSLAHLELKHLGNDRSQEKENGWRFSYALLDNQPLSALPAEAIAYPRADARGTLDVALKQLQPRAEETLAHDPFDGKCLRYGCGGLEGPCATRVRERYNIPIVHEEMRAAFALRLASIWGMRTDPQLVPHIVNGIRAEHESSRREFFQHGITRVRPCNKKAGVYEEGDDISVEWLEGMRPWLEIHTAQPWSVRRKDDVTKALAAIAKGRPIRFAEDKTRLRELVEAAYQGQAPLTDGGASGERKTSTSRDTLEESGDPLLEHYGESGGNEKLFSTYIDVMELGTSTPVCPEFNSLVTTQRTSCRKPNLQQLPRKGLIRNAFVPRGYVYE